MEKLTAQFLEWVTNTFGGILGIVGDKLLLVTDILMNEWRFWFVMGVTIAVVNYTKKFIVHRNHKHRAKILRMVTIGIAFPFSLYEFWSYDYPFEISIAITIMVVPFYHTSRWVLRKVLPGKVMQSKVIKYAAPSRSDEEEDEYDGATMIGGSWKK